MKTLEKRAFEAALRGDEREISKVLDEMLPVERNALWAASGFLSDYIHNWYQVDKLEGGDHEE